MKEYSNAHPGGVFIDTRRPKHLTEHLQEKANIQGTAPVCEKCKHRMSLRPSLRETPWRSMKPSSPNFEDETNRVLARLRAEVQRLAASGQSKYVCHSCTRG